MSETKKFFCGCTPRDSTFALGIILTIFSMLTFGVTLKGTIRSFHSATMAEFFSVQLFINGETSSLILGFRFLLLMLLLLSLAMVGAHMVLVAGVIKENAILVQRWKMAFLGGAFLSTIIMCGMAVLCFMSQCSDTVASFFIVVGFVHACFILYVISIVSVHHKIIDDNFKKFSNNEDI